MNKSIRKDDVVTIPFMATKEWELSNTLNTDVILSEAGNPIAVEFVSYGSGDGNPVWDTSCNIAKEQQEIDRVNYREGERRSGIFYPDTEPTNADGTYKRLVYAQIKGVFYNKYRDPTKMWGMEYIDFEKSQTKKFLVDSIRLFDIPQVIFGEKILENSVFITDNTLDDDYLINDDGFNNLIAGTNIFSRYQETYPFVNVFESGSNNLCNDYFDFNPPLAPTALTAAVAPTTTSVNLNWTDNSNNEDGFVVERSSSVSGSIFSTVGYTGINISTFVDTPVSYSTWYSYRVYAYNSFGTSSFTNIASVLIPPFSAACVPITISIQPANTSSTVGGSPFFFVTVSSGSSLTYQWQSGSVDLSNGVYYSGVTTDTLLITDVQFIHTGSYRVLINNPCTTAGATSSAAILTVNTASIPPAAPSSLTATSGSAILEWVSNSDNEAGFSVERSINSGSTWSGLTSVAANITTSTDNTVATPGEYSYRVYAHNVHGSSSFSATASISFIGECPPETGTPAPSGLAPFTIAGNKVYGEYVQLNPSGTTWIDNNVFYSETVQDYPDGMYQLLYYSGSYISASNIYEVAVYGLADEKYYYGAPIADGIANRFEDDITPGGFGNRRIEGAATFAGAQSAFDTYFNTLPYIKRFAAQAGSVYERHHESGKLWVEQWDPILAPSSHSRDYFVAFQVVQVSGSVSHTGSCEVDSWGSSSRAKFSEISNSWSGTFALASADSTSMVYSSPAAVPTGVPFVGTFGGARIYYTQSISEPANGCGYIVEIKSGSTIIWEGVKSVGSDVSGRYYRRAGYESHAPACLVINTRSSNVGLGFSYTSPSASIKWYEGIASTQGTLANFYNTANFALVSTITINPDYAANTGPITSIKGIDKLPALQYLYIGKSPGLTTIPTIPEGVLELECYSSGLFNCPGLPSTLTWLNIAGNIMDSEYLPPMPPALIYFGAGTCGLAAIPKLPNTVETIDVQTNQIGIYGDPLAPWPTSLKVLNIAQSDLSALTIPTLPVGVVEATFYQCSLTQAQMQQICQNLVNNGGAGNLLSIDGNGTPNAATMTLIGTLQTNGWTSIFYDP